jgi:hypothetical protein
MPRTFHIVATLMLAAAPGLYAQKGAKPPKAAPPPPPPPRVNSKPGNPRPNGQPKPGAQSNPGGRGPAAGGPKLANPMANPVLRMMAMPPEQRERILEKLPPQRQAEIRQNLEKFDQLPAPEKARRLQNLQRFANLPPEKQQILERQLPAFNSLPEERRTALAKEIGPLSRMPDSERQAKLNSEDFKGRFSPSEIQMLSDISQNYPFPGK